MRRARTGLCGLHVLPCTRPVLCSMRAPSRCVRAALLERRRPPALASSTYSLSPGDRNACATEDGSARASDRRTSHPRTSTGIPELTLPQINRTNSWQPFRAAALRKRARVWFIATSWFLVAFLACVPPAHNSCASVYHDQTTRRSGTPCQVACSDVRMRSSTHPVKTVPHKDARIFCPAGGAFSRLNSGQPWKCPHARRSELTSRDAPGATR